MDRDHSETKRLRRNVEWALRRALDPATVLPMLHRLARLSAEGSDDNVYAQRRIAELVVDQHPWRAALCARRVLAAQPSDDGAWSILALAYALLGHYRCAAQAYRHALELAPTNAAYAHNLGHLMDVALGQPKAALPWLTSAYEATYRRSDVAASLAHALGRAGDLAEAKRVTARALRVQDAGHAREHLALARWLEQGAPNEASLLPHRPHRPPGGLGHSPWQRSAAKGEGSTRGRTGRRVKPLVSNALDSVLARGLSNLPLNREQRGRARELARTPSVLASLLPDDSTLVSSAAAIAYAIVHADQVPLTQAEVAACFRVSVPALRGRFKALRSQLEIPTTAARLATEKPR